MKRLVWVTFAVIVMVCHSAAQVSRLQSILQTGEELQYRVSWKFLRLGTLTIRTERVDDMPDSVALKFVMIVESNPSLPLVNIHEYNACITDVVSLMSKSYYGDFRNGNDHVEIRSAYDEQNKRVTYSERDKQTDRVLVADTLTNVGPFMNGPGLFFYTRWKADRQAAIDVPTLVGGKIQTTRLDFTGLLEYLEIDAIDHPVPCRRYTGIAEWKGGTSAGLSGEFTGWVSDDAAAVIVRAKVKVLLGSICLELERWNRPGWVPSSISLVKK